MWLWGLTVTDHEVLTFTALLADSSRGPGRHPVRDVAQGSVPGCHTHACPRHTCAHVSVCGVPLSLCLCWFDHDTIRLWPPRLVCRRQDAAGGCQPPPPLPVGVGRCATSPQAWRRRHHTQRSTMLHMSTQLQMGNHMGQRHSVELLWVLTVSIHGLNLKWPAWRLRPPVHTERGSEVSTHAHSA